MMLRPLTSILFTTMLCGNIIAATISPTRLTCEYQTDPTQLDVPQPRFSWVNDPKPGKHGLSQKAYEIRVIRLADKHTMWNSGKVISDNSLLVRYAGTPLSSATQYGWQVRVWDRNNDASPWSRMALFTTGIMNHSLWKCQWIGAPWHTDQASFYSGITSPAPLLRREFSIERNVKSALFFGTGLGYFELYVNGSRVGDQVLSPNQTNYDHRPALDHGFIPIGDNFTDFRVPYVGYDITQYLHRGSNAVGAILGNGFYNSLHPAGQRRMTEPYGSPRLFGQIIITYDDGTTTVVPTDTLWKACHSAIIEDGPYLGETYDATREHPGWSKPGFDDTSWQNATVRKAPCGDLFAQNGPPDKVCRRYAPTSITATANGTYVVTFPEEISGWVRLSGINGNRGDTIAIDYGSEWKQGTNRYILSGKGNECYNARFTWFAFHTVTISGWNGPLTTHNIVAEAVNSDVRQTAHFSCSNDLFNKINDCYVRSQLDNMHGSIASDCPHRERTAYTGDGQVACAAAMENLDAAAFYNKWIADIRGAQIDSTGYVPNAAPWQPTAGGGVPWGAAINIIPWEFYLHYADKQILADNYNAMKRHVEFMRRFVTDGIMERKDSCLWVTLGDWCPPGPFVSKALVHTWYFWKCASITADVARILGLYHDADTFSHMAQTSKDAFHRTFFNPEKGSYGPYGGDIFALAMGLPEQPNLKKKVQYALKASIDAASGHIDTGIYAASLFFNTLTQNGLTELAYEAMAQTTYPSFGHWIAQGATTTWEQWDGKNSRNHPMFGGGLTWFYRCLSGLKLDPAQPGYRHIIIEPVFPKKLHWAKYSIMTPLGLATSEWARSQELSSITLTITVPVGSTATVRLPFSHFTVTEGSKHASPVSLTGNTSTLTLPQGHYKIHATTP